jgi:hypothetical protein
VRSTRLRAALLPAVFFLAAYCSFADDFRKTSWLMTRDQIIASEDTQVDSEMEFAGQQQVVFRALVKGHSGSITYLLENNQLRAASYNFGNDERRQIYSYMKDSLTTRYGKPSIHKDEMLGWRLERTEIALTYLPNKSCYVAFWEKAYFARLNNLSPSGDRQSF